MKKAVYVAGCLGFIGKHVTLKLLECGYQVYGVDSCTYAADLEFLDTFSAWDNFTFEKVDINDIEYLHDCDAFINCAAETHVGNSIVNSEKFVHSNIDGVRNVLECFRNYRIEGTMRPIFVHFSTDEVYGDIDNGSNDESSPLKPSNPYSATKAAGDMLILAWNRTYNIKYIIVRPSNNYGFNQYIEKLIPKTIKYLNMKRKIPLHDGGQPTRDWLNVKDTANAIYLLLEKAFSEDKHLVENQIFNISAGEHHRNIEVVSQIIATHRFFSLKKARNEINDFVDFTYSRCGQDVRYSVNSTKLRETAGWEPKADFSQELRAIVKEGRENYKYQW